MDKEEDFDGASEDTMSNSSSFLEGRSSSVVISKAQLATDRNLYKSAKSCSSCGVAFGTLLSLNTAKKYVCKFCYTGVCQKCSPHRLQHPESKRKERCCGICYSAFVADSIRVGMEVDLTRRSSEADVLMQKYVEEKLAQEEEARTNHLLSEEIHTLRHELGKQKSEHEAILEKKGTTEQIIRNDIQELVSEEAQIAKELKAVEEEIAAMKTSRDSGQKSQRAEKAKYSELLRLNEETEGDLRRLEGLLKAEPTVEVQKEEAKSFREAELKRSIDTDRELLVRLQQENIRLVSLRNEWRDRQKNEEARQRSLSTRYSKDCEMTRFVEEIRAGSDQFDLPEVQRRIALLQVECDHLRSQISSAKSQTDSSELTELRTEIAKEKERNNRLMLSFQETLLSDHRKDPLAQDRCKCAVM